MSDGRMSGGFVEKGEGSPRWNQQGPRGFFFGVDLEDELRKVPAQAAVTRSPAQQVADALPEPMRSEMLRRIETGDERVQGQLAELHAKANAAALRETLQVVVQDAIKLARK